MKSSTLRALVGHFILVLTALPIVLFSFQNCAPKSFSSGGSEVTTPVNPQGCEPPTVCPVDPKKPFNLVPHTIRTEMNHPKDWTAPHDGEKQGFRISLAATLPQNTLDIPDKGTVEILDSDAYTLRFTPDFGFRGNIVIWLHAIDNTNATKSSVEVTIEVGNSLNFFQPALAVRGSGCVMCHSDVRANIVTDFGLGNDWFFAKNINSNSGMAWNFGGIYGDFEAFYVLKTNPELGNWALLNHQADKKIYVPAGASLPVDDAKQKTGTTTMTGYLKHRLAASTYAGTRAADKVIERANIYIGAPTAARIRQAFNWTSTQGAFVYEKEDGAGAFDLSGLRDMGGYFTNDSTLTCDGDLMINGTLLLNDLNLRTHTGCRIYATKSVYIYGPITYDPVANSDLRNLQITSATAVLMGLGKVKNGNTHCEETAPVGYNWYWERQKNYDSEKRFYTATLANYDKAILDSAYMRLAFFWPNANHFTRDTRAPLTVGRELYDEMTATIGAPLDASCRAGGRNISYTRLMLNAPRVESRYNGDFSGSIVAEISLMALGQFKFQFDPVFTLVPILPKLTDADYLKID